MAIILGSAERAAVSACKLRGVGSYLVCSGVVAEVSEEGYEHVICLRVASEECVQGGGGDQQS
jgi:hypothetical protein